MEISSTAHPCEIGAGSQVAVRVLSGERTLLFGLALVALLLHLLVAGHYGYFRDELYYLDAGRQLAAGYVDFPAFIAVLAALLERLSGASLVAIHAPPAIASALLVLLTGLMARELGGGRVAQGLAALAALVNITYLAMGSIFSMDAWDELWWALIAYLIIRLTRRQLPRLWLLVGAVAALGVLTKLTMLAFGGALCLGFLLAQRDTLRTREPWLAIGIAALGLVPYLLWQVAHGWPSLLFWGRYGADHTLSLSLPAFLGEQVYTMNPLTLPLWSAGVYALLRRPALRAYRPLGVAYLVLFVVFALVHAKSYFLAPAYAFLFAAGAVTLESVLPHGRRRLLRPVYVAGLLLSGVLLAPIAMPLLPPAIWTHLYGFLGGDAGAQQERHKTAQLPQWLADRFGWDTLTATVAGVYAGLPAGERARACVFTLDYGEAGALNMLGPAHGLPPAISGHNSYYLWGPGACSGEVVITVGLAKSDVEQSFASVTPAVAATCDYCMPEENDLPIFVARRPRLPLGQTWVSGRHYN